MENLQIPNNANPSRITEEHESIHTNLFIALTRMIYITYETTYHWQCVNIMQKATYRDTHNFSIKPLEVDMVDSADNNQQSARFP
jgi:hypothetical protein